ncbi:MAG: UDP-N-acetylmuramoyl-tripeptide--D-alanyl-D-alanine ligase [Saprospiraceae bacterium]|nr:UDP-N-acetylmuramoyl-tripeptide--D-alanyl-D-alanine ligase [Saprospiraceae bacterium]
MHISDLYAVFQAHPEVTTDSRRITEGCLFFALKGDLFDGNRFASAALQQGAAYAVVDDPGLAGLPRHILVPDVLTTLQDLARHHRRQFDIPFIGITGSNGKTTTKELVAGVLAMRYRVHFTQGNLNNHIGVPLTLLSMPADTEMAVIEMGANHQGEIDALSRIAEPDFGLITNIGKAHLEGFGGIEGVKKGKSELYRFLAERQGVAFINSDEPFLEELAQALDRKFFYGRKPNANYPIALLKDQPTLQVSFAVEDGNEQHAQSQLIGAYNFGNIATAIAVGLYFGVSASDIKSAIERYTPENMRSQVVRKGGNTIILDAYNANPSSTRQALLTFGAMEAQNKIAILGDMLELGEAAREEHQAIAELAQELHLSQIILVGAHYASIDLPTGALHFPHAEALRMHLLERAFSNTHFLIKGSRGIKLETIVEAVKEA